MLCLLGACRKVRPFGKRCKRCQRQPSYQQHERGLRPRTNQRRSYCGGSGSWRIRRKSICGKRRANAGQHDGKATTAKYRFAVKTACKHRLLYCADVRIHGHDGRAAFARVSQRTRQRRKFRTGATAVVPACVVCQPQLLCGGVQTSVSACAQHGQPYRSGRNCQRGVRNCRNLAYEFQSRAVGDDGQQGIHGRHCQVPPYVVLRIVRHDTCSCRPRQILRGAQQNKNRRRSQQTAQTGTAKSIAVH